MYKTYRNSYICTRNGIDYLYIREETPFNIGYASGILLLKAENKLVHFFKKWYIQAAITIVYYIFKLFYKYIHVPQKYMEELRGYHAATGIQLSVLYFMNFSFDIMKKSGIYCSTFAGHADNSYVARNTDFHPLIAAFILKMSNPLVVTLFSEARNILTHVSFPLFVGVLNGFNEHRISVNAHQITYTNDRIKSKHLATSLVCRMLLENCDSLEQIKNFIPTHIPCRSLNVLVSSYYEKRDIILEIKPPLCNINVSFAHFTCCTTHFQSSTMNGFHSRPTTASKIRLDTLLHAMYEAFPESIQECVTLLQNTSHGIRYNHSGKSIANNGTFQSFIFDLKKFMIYIAKGSKTPIPLNGTYTSLDVSMDYPQHKTTASIIVQ